LIRESLLNRVLMRNLMNMKGSYADMYTKQAMNYLAVNNIEEGVVL